MQHHKDPIDIRIFYKEMKGSVLVILFIAALMAVGCSQTEKTEGITADITAAQMEGRRAAGCILGPEWKDSALLQKALIEAKVKQSKYLIAGHPECAAAFDSSFISTIRTVNPSLAKKLVPVDAQ